MATPPSAPAWRRLERPANTSLEREIFAEKIAALDRVRSGSTAALHSADLLVAVLALAWSWVAVPAALGSLASEDVAIQRQRVIQSIETLCAAAMPEDRCQSHSRRCEDLLCLRTLGK